MTQIEHGTLTMYRKVGCRCKPCTARHSENCYKSIVKRRNARRALKICIDCGGELALNSKARCVHHLRQEREREQRRSTKRQQVG